MPLAVAPQQVADLPDIASRTTMRAATSFAPSMYGKLDDVVGLCLHDPEKVTELPGFDCEPALTDVPPARICTKTETCVENGASGSLIAY